MTDHDHITVIPNEYGQILRLKSLRRLDEQRVRRACQYLADRWAKKHRQRISNVIVRWDNDMATMQDRLIVTWVAVPNSTDERINRATLDLYYDNRSLLLVPME